MRKILVAVDLQKDFIDGSLTVPGAADFIPVINGAKKKFGHVLSTRLSRNARNAHDAVL